MFKFVLYALILVIGLFSPNNSVAEDSAVTVGVSDYASPWIDDLNYCDDDARDIHDLLQGYGWYVSLLVDSEATEDNILDEIQDVATSVGSDQYFLFFFSGHGAKALITGDCYICPHDWSILPYIKDIREGELANYLDYAQAEGVCVILDACKSGGFIDSLQKSSYVVLTACTEDEDSLEHPALQHGVFSYYVIEGLTTGLADTNGDNIISAEEVYDYAAPRATAWNPNQHPQIYDGNGSAELPIYYLAIPTSDGFDYPVGPPYVTEARDGDGWWNAQDFGFPNPQFDNKLHLGEDWNSEECDICDANQPVYAVSNGIVRYAEYHSSDWGYLVLIEHQAPSGRKFNLPDGTQVDVVWSQYGHLANIDPGIQEDEPVRRGQQIGTIGDYPHGSGENYHLHFELRTQELDPGGPGYSYDTSGWTDPSDFIDLNRPFQPPSCPSLYFWNGTYFVRNGFIFPGAMPRKNEYRDHMYLGQRLVPNGDRYLLQIRETEPERSFIDMAKLIIVDHSSNINIAVNDTGHIFTYKDRLSPRSCTDETALERLPLIETIKDRLAFSGYNDDSMVINFDPLKKPLNIRVLSPISARHSVVGDVILHLSVSDDWYIRMHPRDVITLTFPYYPLEDEERDFIFVGEGFYVPLGHWEE